MKKIHQIVASAVALLFATAISAFADPNASGGSVDSLDTPAASVSAPPASLYFAQPKVGVLPLDDGKEMKDMKEAKETPPVSRFQIYGWVEGGITTNGTSPRDHQNFGHLFTDRANEPLLNQAVITAERTLDPKATGFDWGFKVQFMYGTDARFIHSLGLLDLATDEIMQPDLVEAYLNLHFPILTESGVDLKAGKFVTLEGAETIDPRANVFYSHTYIFNFGIPFNHTGALATIHTTKWLDIYAGITRGVNTSVWDNNSSVSFHGGLGLTFFDGKLTSLASTSIGPETPNDNRDMRYLNDITTTWKITDKLTSITDLNYIEDDAGSVSRGYGVAQYFTYALKDWLTLGIRYEVWRDENGFFVAQFASHNDFIHLERGDSDFVPDPRTVGGGSTTYSALTFGVTIQPPVPKPLAGLMIRPEVRWDRSLNGTTPFNDSSQRNQFTAGLDVILKF